MHFPDRNPLSRAILTYRKRVCAVEYYVQSLLLPSYLTSNILFVRLGNNGICQLHSAPLISESETIFKALGKSFEGVK